jgi:hypothetical protein
VRRSFARTALAVIFVLLTLNAWAQAVLGQLGVSSDPSTLVALQVLVGAAAAAAAVGSWIGARWAPTAAVLYGVVTAGMIIALESILGLGRDARNGLLTGGAVVMLFGLGAAWYLRRDIARTQDAAPMSHP